VVTVDDQDVFRRVLRDLVDATPGFEHVGEAASGAEALELVAELGPDLVLLDVRMPGLGGIETARRLEDSPDPPVVVLISLDRTSSPPPGCGSVAYVCKQDLSTVALQEIWTQHAIRRDSS
jgi:DNA-binding NarL/FixJ family response regulator